MYFPSLNSLSLSLSKSVLMYLHTICVPDLESSVSSTRQKHPSIQRIPLNCLHTVFMFIGVGAANIANCFGGVLHFPRMVCQIMYV